MMFEKDYPRNRVESLIRVKDHPSAVAACHCKDCYVEIKAGDLCPPCKANADKGRMGFRKADSVHHIKGPSPSA